MTGNEELRLTEPAEKAVCRVCGCPIGARTFEAREMMQGLRETFTYEICDGCGSFQLKEVPRDLGKYYGEGYYSFNNIVKPRYSWLEKWLKRSRARHALGNRNLVGAVMSRVKGHWPYFDWFKAAEVHFGTNILDVGCGKGDNLLRFASDGFTSLTGVDPFVDADVTLAEKILIYKRTIDEMEGSFDCIFAHHSFEHMPNPQESLRQMARLLNAGGAALIAIPVAGCWAWETYGPNWYQIDAPRHLVLPSASGMRVLAERAGLTIQEIMYYSSDLQMIQSTFYAENVAFAEITPELMRERFPDVERKRLQQRAEQLNAEQRGDQACFILRKR
ncbi:MAG TPA: class I SAM-dependent methyltransferase [Phycisphaerae bacterium]|nr:class I SAM-dependent methyltransferase [Phycisphaerae bacterium]